MKASTNIHKDKRKNKFSTCTTYTKLGFHCPWDSFVSSNSINMSLPKQLFFDSNTQLRKEVTIFVHTVHKLNFICIWHLIQWGLEYWTLEYQTFWSWTFQWPKNKMANILSSFPIVRPLKNQTPLENWTDPYHLNSQPVRNSSPHFNL